MRCARLLSALPKALALGACLLAACTGRGELEIRAAWIPAPPRGSEALAGYGVIVNGTGSPVTITGVDGEDFERAALHRTEIEDGQARMRPVDALTIPPGGRAEMFPGGLHLMLLRPQRELAPGDRVAIAFRLADGDVLEAEFVISHHQPTND